MLIAAIASLIISQTVLAAHEAEHGHGPHEHNGQTCVLSLASPGLDKAVGAAALDLAVPAAVFRLAVRTPVQSEIAFVAIRASRPRAPPAR